MNLIRPYRSILILALAVGLILTVPWLVMQFGGEVSWSAFDFAVAGTLLFGVGLAYVLLTRKASSLIHRLALGAALATALFLLWVNLAVGIIGSEDNPANWMYVGVLAVLLAGALLARFRPAGMARALFATALAQALATMIALIVLRAPEAGEVLLVNGFFAALWVASALLFRQAHAARIRAAAPPPTRG